MRNAGSLVGATVGGLYHIRHLIGQGGMGEVYSAEGHNGEKVAIKVLHERAAQDPDLVARFRRESAIAAQIRSPFVAGIVGAGQDRNGRLWIAFEQLAGEGLDERLRREGYLSFEEVAPIVDDALQGLMAAHEAGVVHRDIKPANLFIESRPRRRGARSSGPTERTRILDFGISKIQKERGRGKSEPSLTAFDATLGSFAYMAPEQVRASARVDERADLYALGAVAFRALTGRLPFEGTNAAALLALKLEREPPSLAATTGDDWPAPIERFLEGMMARDRDGRYASAADALGSWRDVRDRMGRAPAPQAPRSARVPSSDDWSAGERTEVTATWVGDKDDE